MKKNLTMAICLLTGLFFSLLTNCWAANSKDLKKQLDLADDITTETMVGPGKVQVTTGKDILMSFGGQIRVIPTSESNWDFGMSDNAENGFLGGGLVSDFLKSHPNESGWVNDSYIRSEDRLYFNAMAKDRKWSFYAALEYDDVWETSTVDNRSGKSAEYSKFGLERLHGIMRLSNNMQLHAGFDIWGLDIIEAAALVYGDDNPGLWITGNNGDFDYNVGYFKLSENDFQTGIGNLNDETDSDRDLYAGYLNWKFAEKQKIKFLYAYDRMRNTPVTDLLAGLSGGALGISGNSTPKVDSHHMGAYYIGQYNNLDLFIEGIYQFGSADNTGMGALGKAEDYDISAFAFAADFGFQFEGMLTGFPMRPHIGIIYASGDDDPNDDSLGGYNGIANAQRFSKIWGGENTIIGDTNWVTGTALYGYIPEFFGNGTPVPTGGLQNFSGLGNGRGDNPGLTMISIGLTTAPKPTLIYKTNLNIFQWNEDFEVANLVNPALGYTEVEAGYVGTEWDNEVTLVMSKNTFIKGQASFFFPGERIKDVTAAMSGSESDETAMRLAVELIWNF